MDAITQADALELFKVPRTLGDTPSGEKIIANVGRFGPYLKFGAKYVSLKEDDPYTVTLERAQEVIRAKLEADANRIIHDFGVDDVQVLNGRYGPYITNKLKNARIPKGREPKALTLDECRALLEAAPLRSQRGRGRARGKPAKPAAERPAPASAAEQPPAAVPRPAAGNAIKAKAKKRAAAATVARKKVPKKKVATAA
jgi:DNA topoisomerase-1